MHINIYVRVLSIFSKYILYVYVFLYISLRNKYSQYTTHTHILYLKKIVITINRWPALVKIKVLVLSI